MSDNKNLGLRLPPLNALRAFNSVTKHMSFQEAARELYVTPAALSYQIKQLEEFLDLKLFNRLNRAIELTDHGRLLAPGINSAFDQLNQTMKLLQKKQNSGVLVISAGPAFTAKWLTPRLYRFMALYPTIETRISASLKLCDLTVDDVDIAIRFGNGSYPDCHSVKLFDDYVVPMCSPELLAKIQPLTVERLLDQTLIYDDTHIGLTFKIGDWRDWFQKMDVDLMKRPHKELHFNVADHAINAAVAGAGVVLGRKSLAQSDIDSGRLVIPFIQQIKVSFSFYAICLKSRQNEQHIKAFFDWLSQEVEGDIDLSTPGPVV